MWISDFQRLEIGGFLDKRLEDEGLAKSRRRVMWGE